MLKQNWKLLLIFLLLSVGIILAGNLTYNSCETLDYYLIASTEGDLVPGYTDMALKGGILIAALVLLLILRKKRAPQYRTVKMITILFLPLFLLYGTLLSIPRHIRDRHMVQAICGKTSENHTLKGLTREEYDFVKKQSLRQLPALPKTARQIGIYFFGEAFFGEYLLQVNFQCSSAEPVPQDTRWHTHRTDTAAGVKYITYEDGVK